MTAKEIKQAIATLKREMRADGVRVVSCFNAGLTRAELSYNTQLFRLKTELIKAGQAVPVSQWGKMLSGGCTADKGE